MSEHYYTERPSVKHKRQSIQVTLRGHTLTFMTDAGVFSKEGIDFGSKLLIEHVQICDGANVLDMGCGYGPIGLFAAKLVGAGSVTMLDVNERAVSLSRENAKLNHIRNVTIAQSDLYAVLDDEKFTTILTNPPIRAGKHIVHRIYEEALAHLEDDGELWVVIQKKQGAASTFQKLNELFLNVNEVTKAKGYRVYRAFEKNFNKKLTQ